MKECDRIAFGNWISGFVDGEGHLGLCIKREHPNRIRPSAVFSIGLRADDVGILEEIMTFFGCGAIYPQRDRGKKNPSVTYKVYKPIELLNTIIPHFDEFPLRAKKANELELWKLGVRLIVTVSSRKVYSLGHKGGSMSKWSKTEIANFESLASTLSVIREY